MPDLQTDPVILAALRAAAGRPMTAEELHQQRVSFVMGSLKDDSAITRQQVERAVSHQAGQDARP